MDPTVDKMKKKFKDQKWVYLNDDKKKEDELWLTDELKLAYTVINQDTISSMDWNKTGKVNIICDEESVKLINLLQKDRQLLLKILDNEKKMAIWKQDILQSQIASHNLRITKSARLLISEILTNINKILLDGDSNLFILCDDNSKNKRYYVVNNDGKCESLHEEEIEQTIKQAYISCAKETVLKQIEKYIEQNFEAEKCKKCKSLKQEGQSCIFCSITVRIAKLEKQSSRKKRKKSKSD